MAFACHYELDQRPNFELVNFVQKLYRLIPAGLGSSTNIPLDGDGLPDAVHYYLLYVSALVHGAADAALTLVLHNLGREARLQERSIFEYWVRAKYYSEYPEFAKKAMRASVFRERDILNELGYPKESARYHELNDVCEKIETRYPEARRFQEPSLTQILGVSGDKDLARFYAFTYRVPSQLMHATFAGSGNVVSEAGVRFDSREDDPNISLELIATYLLAFLAVLAEALHLGDTNNLMVGLQTSWETLQDTLQRQRGQAKG